MTIDKTTSLICSETFSGGIKTENGLIENEKTYRFKIIKNQSGSYDCIPESFSEKNENWTKVGPGWNVENVIDSTGLYLNFGSNQVLLPTESVWNEIREFLKSNVNSK